MTDLLAFPLIEDNFFTLTLFLQNLVNALANGAVYALMALTVVMIYKTTGHLNFAQGEMAMFTTFIVFVLAVEQGWPVWLAIGVVVIGAMNRLEIWDEAAWNAYSEAQEEAFAELSEEVIPGI